MKHDDNKPNDNQDSNKKSVKTEKDLLEEISKTDPNFYEEIKKQSNVYHLGESHKEIEIIIEKLSDIKPRKIDWLWQNVVAFRKITLFAGEPGVGKSQLLLYIASILSNGLKFHFQPIKVEPQNVLILSGEDHAEDTITPRLMALNANIDRIHHVKGIKKIDKGGNAYFDVICLIENIFELEQKIIANNYKLIIVDPISLYLGSVDEYKNKEIRSALCMLTALAERHDLAIILNSHFSKRSGNVTKSAIDRVMGSIGLAAAARIVFGILKDPDNLKKRLFLPIKNNIGPDEIGYSYEIKQIILDNNILTSRIEWLNEKIDKTANDILNPPLKIEAPKREEAKEFLLEMLKDGACMRRDLVERAKEFDISYGRLYAAKSELKIIEDYELGNKRNTFWRLP